MIEFKAIKRENGESEYKITIGQIVFRTIHAHNAAEIQQLLTKAAILADKIEIAD